jgi:hypothetical protein
MPLPICCLLAAVLTLVPSSSSTGRGAVPLPMTEPYDLQ